MRRTFEPKGVKDWTEEDLMGYNIKVEHIQDYDAFFGQPPSASESRLAAIEPAALEDETFDEENWEKYRPETF